MQMLLDWLNWWLIEPFWDFVDVILNFFRIVFGVTF